MFKHLISIVLVFLGLFMGYFLLDTSEVGNIILFPIYFILVGLLPYPFCKTKHYNAMFVVQWVIVGIYFVLGLTRGILW